MKISDAFLRVAELVRDLPKTDDREDLARVFDRVGGEMRMQERIFDDKLAGIFVDAKAVPSPPVRIEGGKTVERWGIDIGRVVVAGDGPDTSFFKSDDSAMLVPPVKGVFEGVAAIVARAGADNVWLVSKCGPAIQKRSLAWLDNHGFWTTTGMRPDHIRFCLTRPEKAEIAKDLGLTHFVDDRQDVIGSMQGIVKHRFLFGPQKHPVDKPEMIGIAIVATWTELLLTLVWNGIARPDRVAGTLQVGVSEDGRDVVVNHPKLAVDADGAGYLKFSPMQARHFAASLLVKASEIDDFSSVVVNEAELIALRTLRSAAEAWSMIDGSDDRVAYPAQKVVGQALAACRKVRP